MRYSWSELFAEETHKHNYARKTRRPSLDDYDGGFFYEDKETNHHDFIRTDAAQYYGPDNSDLTHTQGRRTTNNDIFEVDDIEYDLACFERATG